MITSAIITALYFFVGWIWTNILGEDIFDKVIAGLWFAASIFWAFETIEKIVQEAVK